MLFKKSFHIITYGCTFNNAESLIFKNQLISAGYIPCSLTHAKTVIINTCGVKSQTEHKILYQIKEIKLKKNQNLIITGCLPWISPNLYNKILESNENIIGILGLNALDK
ncbi:MAG: hypothetical protein GF364_15100, partial [Candidatus Lokiarchaeota archaeon]|nr:hypothetical protein [Candidatus Lokiarchaeota archaeon]